MTRPITFCLAYYDNPSMLARQMRDLCMLPRELYSAISLVVVDDASPTTPAAEVFAAVDHVPFVTRLYRMREDTPWNQDACRNLAVAEARSEWLLLTDMDHVPSGGLWRRLILGNLDPAHAYTMRRVTAPDLKPYKPHPNSYVMTRAIYERTGGYDERYAGVYGTDGMFNKRLAKAAPMAEIKETLVLYSREVIPDASTRTLARKGPEADAAKLAAAAQIQASGHPEPVRGRFAWDRLL